MRAVAQWLPGRGFTSTKKYLSVFVSLKLNWVELRPLMRAIAKWLVCALATGAPKIGFSVLYMNLIRFFRGANRLVHIEIPVMLGLSRKLNFTQQTNFYQTVSLVQVTTLVYSHSLWSDLTRYG